MSRHDEIIERYNRENGIKTSVYSDPRGPLQAMEAKLIALQIIFTSPLWPYESAIPPAALPFYNAIACNGKQYALAVAVSDLDTALRLASEWTAPLNHLLDNVKAKDDPAVMTMLAIYKHYIDAMQIDFKSIQR